MTKKINQHYFDKESKAVYYVLGAWYGCGTRKKIKNCKDDGTVFEYNGIRFGSKTRKLVEIVQRELQSQHKITPDPNKIHSYRFEVIGVPTLCGILEELGALKSKRERDFPKIEEQYISHFVRGFFDARASIYRRNKKTRIEIMFNPSFISGLKKVLEKYAHVKGGGLKKGHVGYSQSNAVKIHDFLYKDWAYIQRHNIYLPFKKRCFNLKYVFTPPSSYLREQGEEKIRKAKVLLAKDLPVGVVASMLYYSSSMGLSHYFRKITGMSPTQYKNSHPNVIRIREAKNRVN